MLDGSANHTTNSDSTSVERKRGLGGRTPTACPRRQLGTHHRAGNRLHGRGRPPRGPWYTCEGGLGRAWPEGSQAQPRGPFLSPRLRISLEPWERRVIEKKERCSKEGRAEGGRPAPYLKPEEANRHAPRSQVIMTGFSACRDLSSHMVAEAS